jgi:predicted nucleic acid-binding protein
MILVDTNILLGAAQPSHVMHTTAVTAVERLRIAEEVLCMVSQVLYEFWVVATRQVELNGLGMTATEANADLGCCS